jgi:tetratricopeptide (TPR) repeat protein
MDANDYYQQGLKIIADPSKYSVKGTAEARALLMKALDLDPGLSRAKAELAYLQVRDSQNGWGTGRDQSLKQGEELANVALKASDDFEGHWSLAMVYANQGRFDESFTEYQTALTIGPRDNPGLALDLRADKGEALLFGGKPQEAIKSVKEAIAGRVPYWYWWNLARAYYMAGRYQAALDAIDNIADPPNDVRLLSAASHAQLGKLDIARSIMAEFSSEDPSWTIAKSAEYNYAYDSDKEHWLDGLRMAGLTEK